MSAPESEVASLPGHVAPLRSPPVGPILQAKPKPLSVDVGEDASFSCVWRGNPLPRVTWTRRGDAQVKPELGLVAAAGSRGASSQGLALDAPSVSQVLASGPTLRLPAVGPEDAGDYVCRAEPGLSGRGGGAAEARLTVNGEKEVLPSGPGGFWDKKWAEGMRSNGSGGGHEKKGVVPGDCCWTYKRLTSVGFTFVERSGMVG